MKSALYHARDLKRVRRAPQVSPVFSIGDRVMLRSGSPEMLVVDFEQGSVTISYRDGDAQEFVFPAICLEPAHPIQ